MFHIMISEWIELLLPWTAKCIVWHDIHHLTMNKKKQHNVINITWEQFILTTRRRDSCMKPTAQSICFYTLPMDHLFNLEFLFKSVFNLKFQPKFGIQLGSPISIGIHLGECTVVSFPSKPNEINMSYITS